MLANRILCYPNLTSRDPLTVGLLQTGLGLMLLAVVTLVFCYTNVFLKYQFIIRRNEGGGEMSQNERAAISPKSKKLLKKLVLITANSLATFAPFVISIFVMLATKAEIDDNAEMVVLTIFELGLLLNPILIYLLDAKMKGSVNEMLGINRIMLKKKPLSIQQPPIDIHEPTLKVNVMQLKSPMSPAEAHLTPNEIKTVLITRD